MLRLKKRLLIVGALLTLGGAAWGIAYAAIPSAGVISGCYLRERWHVARDRPRDDDL